VLVGGPGERHARAISLPGGRAAVAAEVGAGPATIAAATRRAAEGVGAAPVPPATALASPRKATRGRARGALLLLLVGQLRRCGGRPSAVGGLLAAGGAGIESSSGG
jgi:hypothetical protein